MKYLRSTTLDCKDIGIRKSNLWQRINSFTEIKRYNFKSIKIEVWITEDRKNHLVNHQNTQKNAKIKNQVSNRHTLRVWVVFTVASFVGNPLESIKERQ